MSELPVLIIPAYQPERRLVSLVDDLLASGFPSILVVDDGSAPEKTPIFDELRKKNGVSVLSHAVNLGKGAALKTAFNHILVHMKESFGAVTLDADGQHLPADVLKVAAGLKSNPNSLILGSRDFKEGVPLKSAFGNTLTRHVFHFLIGKKIRDTQTGLRGIPSSLMRDLLVVPSSRYEFELDMLVIATGKRVALIEVPISTVYIDGNRGSHFNPLLDSLRIYFVFLRFVFSSLLTYCADLVVFTVAYALAHNIFFSVVVGRASGAAVGFMTSKSFVFKSEKNAKETLVKFFLLWLSLLGISYGLMILFVEALRFNVYVSRVTVDSVLFVFNFLVQRDLIFGERGGSFQKFASKRFL
ncbi:MAG: bifunctional glycosyltransferase family 2/GtrA family protein [Bdellovibrionota bacterium]